MSPSAADITISLTSPLPVNYQLFGRCICGEPFACLLSIIILYSYYIKPTIILYQDPTPSRHLYQDPPLSRPISRLHFYQDPILPRLYYIKIKSLQQPLSRSYIQIDSSVTVADRTAAFPLLGLYRVASTPSPWVIITCQPGVVRVRVIFRGLPCLVTASS